MAWKEFRRGKREKLDIQEFEFNLEDNLFQLHNELENKSYQHFHYTSFYVSDPKLRHIHKACVRDRVLHHATFRVLYPIFDKSFIYDSYSCRIDKGTHKAVNRLERFCGQLSRNNNRNIFALKCDIQRFFDSIDQDILMESIERKIQDKNALRLIEKIIRSFDRYNSDVFLDSRFRSPRWNFGEAGGNDKRMYRNYKIGLPLGNVTSQLFANIYLNELDQFIKHKLNIKYYLRYCDDFIILSDNMGYLEKLIPKINNFLKTKLKLTLHPNKIIIRKYHQGIDFLGYVVLPYYRTLRTKTKRRILKKIEVRNNDLRNGLISEKFFNQILQSYLGILKHCCGYKIEKIIEILYNDNDIFLSEV